MASLLPGGRTLGLFPLGQSEDFAADVRARAFRFHFSRMNPEESAAASRGARVFH